VCKFFNLIGSALIVLALFFCITGIGFRAYHNWKGVDLKTGFVEFFHSWTDNEWNNEE
jgi:hypothetical protein